MSTREVFARIVHEHPDSGAAKRACAEQLAIAIASDKGRGVDVPIYSTINETLQELLARGQGDDSDGASVEEQVLFHLDYLDSILTYAKEFSERWTGNKTGAHAALSTVREFADAVERLRGPIWLMGSLRNEIEQSREARAAEIEERIGVSEQRLESLGRQIDQEATNVDSIKEQSDFAAKKLEIAVDELRTARDEMDDVRQKVNEIQKEYIAILGVLVAIVLAFNASITFTADSIGAVADMGPFSVGFVVCIVGVFLFNAIFVLLSYLNRITEKWRGQWTLMTRRTYTGGNMLLTGTMLCLGACASASDARLRFEPWVAVPVVLVGLLLIVIGCTRLVQEDAAAGC